MEQLFFLVFFSFQNDTKSIKHSQYITIRYNTYPTTHYNNNNLLLGSSITKSGLHRGPNTRYILYNDTIKIYKLELKPKYINNYNIYTTRIKKKNS